MALPKLSIPTTIVTSVFDSIRENMMGRGLISSPAKKLS